MRSLSTRLLLALICFISIGATSVSAANITGNVTYNDVPVCSMVLANGQYMFTCSGDGSFALDVPLDDNGEITVYTFCSGLAPYKEVITPDQGTGMQIQMLAGEAGAGMEVDYTIKAMNTTWALVEGTITYNSVPVCAMALANGQYQFTCSGDGSFSLLVPLDDMGSILLYGFCEGLPPHQTLFTTNEIDFNVDYDHDGYTVANGDCNDFNAAINPAATEVCGDGVDQDCDEVDQACVDTGGGQDPDPVTGSLCSDTCMYAGDGVCDDGGEGSAYSVCTLGSDCSDCGSRVDLTPVTGPLCSDTCPYAGDGVCDDGGEGAAYSVCPLGSDCSDCGDRGASSSSAVVVGAAVDLSSREVASTGDMIIIDNPSLPLNGMEITVPPGAYTSTTPFQVSAAPVESHTLGELFNPLTPLIKVNNGGQFSKEIMTVKIPVHVPENQFAMAFYYDETQGTLEPMQLISTDSESVTVATHHFSSFIVTGIAQSVLDTYLAEGIQSGFQPGVDDWSFVNRGSYIAPSGHCSGQSIGALWYYTTKPEGDKPLWGSYDNNFSNWTTPELWQDDSYAYRFCSVLQMDENVNSFAENFWREIQGRVWRRVQNGWELVDVPAIGAEGIRNMFALSMLLTHEPQYVAIYSRSGGGHAMIVYAVTRDALHVADPNYPGDVYRTIYYSNGSFTPYASGDNWDEINAGRGKNYETILYLAKSNLIPSGKIAQRWEEVKNGTIGNGIFPNYQIKYLDEITGSYKPLAENQIFTKNKADFGVTGDVSLSIGTYKNSEALPFDSDWKTELVPGDNRIGFLVKGRVGDSREYVDFKYINVIYEPEEPEGESFQYTRSFDYRGDPNIPFIYNVNGTVTNVINPNLELNNYANSDDKYLRITNVSVDEQPTVSGSIVPNIPTHFIYTNWNGSVVEERTYTNPRIQVYGAESNELIETFNGTNFTWTADSGYTWDGTYDVKIFLVYNVEIKTTLKENVYNEDTEEYDLVVKDIKYSTEPELQEHRLDVKVEKDESLHK